MAGNAHRNRHRSKRAYACPVGCKYCAARPKFGNYANKNGHRRNPSRNKKQHKRRVAILDGIKTRK